MTEETVTEEPVLDALQQAAFDHSLNCTTCSKVVLRALNSGKDIELLTLKGCCQEGKILNLLACVGEEHAEKVIGSTPILFGFNKHVSLCEACQRDVRAELKPTCVVGAVFYEEWIKIAEAIAGKKVTA